MTSRSTPCPVLLFTEEAIASMDELTRLLRHLRKPMKSCATCIHCGDCPILVYFNQRFTTALQQVTEKWSLV